MKAGLKAAIVFLFLLPGLAGGAPPDDMKIVVLVTTVKQDSPLQIVGFKLPDKVGGDPVLVLQNMTHNAITAFNVAAAIGNPGPDSRGEAGPAYYTYGASKLYWPEERAIPPNGQREVHEHALRSHLLTHWGSKFGSTCLHVAAVVTSVTFADEEVWRGEYPGQDLWRRSLRPESTKPCQHSATTEATLKEWSGAAGYQPTMGTPSHADTRAVESYSFECPLRNLGGGLVAVCPW